MKSIHQFHLRNGSSLGFIYSPSGDISVEVLKLEVSEGLFTAGLNGGLSFFNKRVSKFIEFKNL
jgi:hypothetical protein